MTTYYAHRTEPVRDHFVYRCFDVEGRLLYIGCSVRPEQRLKEHRNDSKDWIERAAKVKLQGPFSYRKARAVERLALRDEYPLANVTPQRQSAKQRRESWATRLANTLIEETATAEDVFAAWDLAYEAADEIDWFSIADQAIRSKAVA